MNQKQQNHHPPTNPNQNQNQLSKSIEFCIPIKPQYHQALTDAQILLNYLKSEEGQEMLSSFLALKRESYLEEFKCLYCENEPTTEDIIQYYIHNVLRCITSLNVLPTPTDETSGPVPSEKFTLQVLEYEHRQLNVHPLLVPLFKMYSNEESTETVETTNENNDGHEIFVPRRIVNNLDCDELVYFNYNSETHILTLRYDFDFLVKPKNFSGFLPRDSKDTIKIYSSGGELDSNIIGYEPIANIVLLYIFGHLIIVLGTMWNQSDSTWNQSESNEVKSLFIQTNLSSGEKNFISPELKITKQKGESPVLHLNIEPNEESHVGLQVVASLIDKNSVYHVTLEIPLKQELHNELNFLSEVIHTELIQKVWKKSKLTPAGHLENNLYALFDILNKAVITDYSVRSNLFSSLQFNSFLDCLYMNELEQLSEKHKDYLNEFANDFDFKVKLDVKTLHYSPCWLSREVTALNTCEIINGVYHLDAEFAGVPVERLRKWISGIIELNGDPTAHPKAVITKIK